MTFSSVAAKTNFIGFNAAQKSQLLGVLQTAYNGSATARKMFDNWVSTGRSISISNVPNVFQAYGGTGRVEIDLRYINNLSYIDNTGKPVLYSLLGALVHELGHALTGKRDSITATDYQGDNVRFVNTIWRELGIPQQVSYIAQARNDIHRVGYQYTNGASIDAARSGNFDMNSSALGVSRDLLIGGASNNILQSGDGDDFLFGGGGNDQLNGGNGRDTAVYFGLLQDYDIRQNTDGSWTVSNVRGDKDAGSDTLKNIEVLQFDGGKTYELTKLGLNLPTGNASLDTIYPVTDSVPSANLKNVVLTEATAAKKNIAGNSSANVLTANRSGGRLYGLAGNDILNGGLGNDILNGGAGDDILRGNGGANTFVLNAPKFGLDIIQDFVSSQDKLQISARSFGGGLLANVALNSNQLITGSGVSNATTSSQRFIYNTDNGNLYFDADGNGKSEQVQIAVLSNFSNLNTNNFMIV